MWVESLEEEEKNDGAVVSEAGQEEEWPSEEMVRGLAETNTMPVASLVEHYGLRLVASPCETVSEQREPKLVASLETMPERAPEKMPMWSTQTTSESESQRFCAPFSERDLETLLLCGSMTVREQRTKGGGV
jgi:hypothetical protein